MTETELELMKNELNRAHRLIHERTDVEEGRKIAERVQARLVEVGLSRSGYAEWLMAVACDYLGRRLEACEHIDRAFAMDPMEPAYNTSREMIVRALRCELLKLDVEKGGAELGRMYAALADRGLADWDCHLHVARWYAGQKRLEEMKRVLEAVTLLNPGCREAWEGLIALGRDAKDEALVATAEDGMNAAKVTREEKRAKKEVPRA